MTERYHMIVTKGNGETHPTDWATPMEAMTALAIDSEVDKGYTWLKAECYRIEDGERKERQWIVQID